MSDMYDTYDTSSDSSEPDSRNLISPDGHVIFSDNPSLPMPPRFTAPDTGSFVPQAFGHVVDNDDNDMDPS